MQEKIQTNKKGSKIMKIIYPKSYVGFISLDTLPSPVTNDTKALVLHNLFYNYKVLTELYKIQFQKTPPTLMWEHSFYYLEQRL